jgi:hypothetical protein
MVNIKVKTLTNKIYDIQVDENTLVSSLKEKVSEVHDNKQYDHEYKIIHLGKVLNDTDSIESFHEGKLFILMTTKKKIEDVKKPATPPLPSFPPIQSMVHLPPIPSLPALSSLPVIQPVQLNMGNLGNLGLSDNEQNLLNVLLNGSLGNLQNPSMANALNDLNNILNNPEFAGIYQPNEDNDEVDEDHVEPDGENEEENAVEDNNQPALQTNQQFNSEMVGNFTNKEVDEINEITNMGYDYYEVIQIYMAVGKNKEAAMNLLI